MQKLFINLEITDENGDFVVRGESEVTLGFEPAKDELDKLERYIENQKSKQEDRLKEQEV